MASERQKWCRACRRNVLARRPADRDRANLHAAITLLTCGLWLPIAVLAGSVGRPYLCPACGAKC